MKHRLIKEYPRSPKLGTIADLSKGWGETKEWVDSNPQASKEFWEEIKEPIFTSEDIVDIYLGDIYYKVKIATFEIYQIASAMKGGGKVQGFKYFSTKEAAEKYKGENKPKYSKKQINNAINIMFSPKLSRDDSVFGDALKEGYRMAFFKYLENES